MRFLFDWSVPKREMLEKGKKEKKKTNNKKKDKRSLIK